MLLIQEQKRQTDCIASRLNSPSSKLLRSPPEAQPAFGGLLIRSCWCNEPRFALPKLRHMGHKPCFQSLFSAKPRTVLPLPRFPGIAVFSAPALIAAKPQKPCDGGVCGALNSLLTSERTSPQSGLDSVQHKNRQNLNPARSSISFRWLAPFALVCAMNRALPCPNCGTWATSRVFRACSAPSREPFYRCHAPEITISPLLV